MGVSRYNFHLSGVPVRPLKTTQKGDASARGAPHAKLQRSQFIAGTHSTYGKPVDPGWLDPIDQGEMRTTATLPIDPTGFPLFRARFFARCLLSRDVSARRRTSDGRNESRSLTSHACGVTAVHCVVILGAGAKANASPPCPR